MSSGSKVQWDKTKWLLLIAILMIVEGFIFYVSMENSNSQSALGYVSFAGTITSIILAVLAIIYGFVQSGSQERKSEVVSEQMGRIKEVVDSLQKSKSLLGGDLIKLENIANKIEEVAENSHSTKRDVQKLNKSLEKLMIESNDASMDIDTEEGVDAQYAFLESRFARDLIYIIVKASDNNLYGRKDLKQIFGQYVKEVILEDDDSSVNLFAQGVSSGVWAALMGMFESANVVEFNKETEEYSLKDESLLKKIIKSDNKAIDKIVLNYVVNSN